MIARVSERFEELMQGREGRRLLIQAEADRLISMPRLSAAARVGGRIEDDLAAYRSQAIANAVAAIDLEIEIREAENALGCDIAYVRQLRAILESARYPRAKIAKEMRRRMAGLRSAVDEIEAELVDAYQRPSTAPVGVK